MLKTTENIVLADSHCHMLLINQAKENIKYIDIVSNALSYKVKYLLNVGTSLQDSQASIKMLNEMQLSPDMENVNLYTSVGNHPLTEIPNDFLYENFEKSLIEIANSSKKVVALGETGLDYYRLDSMDLDEATSNKKLQIDKLRAHIHVAQSLNLPLILHGRMSGNAILDTLSEYQYKTPGVMHCFTEDYDIAKRALDYGLYISFPGIITFKNALALKDIVKKIPLDRMLIETDAPYLAPIPYRSKINLPGYVYYTAQEIASLHNISIEKVAEITTNNFSALFLNPNKNVDRKE